MSKIEEQIQAEEPITEEEGKQAKPKDIGERKWIEF